MNKVRVIYLSNGAEKKMHIRFANILAKLNHVRIVEESPEKPIEVLQDSIPLQQTEHTVDSQQIIAPAPEDGVNTQQEATLNGEQENVDEEKEENTNNAQQEIFSTDDSKKELLEKKPTKPKSTAEKSKEK